MSIFKFGAKPMEEDAGTEGCVRVRLRSAAATCNNCMDYIV